MAALAWLLAAGCNFDIPPLTLDDGVDLAVDDAPDLAAADAAMAPDLTNDPCGPARTPPVNVLPIRCAIGNPPVLDGDLAEWGPLDFTLTHANAQASSSGASWSGTPAQDDANCSAQWSLRWDLTNLYVAVHVTDDIRGVHATSGAGYEPYLDDAVELYLDGSGDRTATYGADDWQFIVTAAADSQVDKTTNPMGPVPAGYFAVKPDATGAGWAVEFAVPWSTLGANTVVSGRMIGVDFLIDDDDDTTALQQLSRYLLWWNMTSTGCAYPADCTSNFGAAQLVGR